MSNKKPKKAEKYVPPAFNDFVRSDSPNRAIWAPFDDFFSDHTVAVKVRSSDLRQDEFWLILDAALRLDLRAFFLGKVRMCLLCAERPTELFEEIASFLIPGPLTGSWLVRLGPAGYALIVVAPELPLQPGTAALRFCVRWDEECDFLAATHQMLRDTTLPIGLAEEMLLTSLLFEVDRDDAAAVASAHRRHARLVTDWRAVQPESIALH
jgi:hypothetical protein